MDDRYHRAARDGRVDLLKEAYTKELNQPDDDGMTPTLWAAYHGNLDALTLCCRRGGDYDKCDHTGNSCLHLAAQNGHLNCLSFLVKLGANVWKLDNDYNNALTVAGNRGHNGCVQYLDGILNKYKSSNPKSAKEKEQKAKKEAEKRIKKYAKLQEKQLKKMENYYKNTEVKRSTQNTLMDGNPRKTSSSKAPNFSQTIKSDNPKSLFMTQRNMGAMNNFVISDKNRQEAKTLSGFPSSQASNVMFMQVEGMSSLSEATDKPVPGKRGAVQNIFPDASVEEEDEEEEEVEDLPPMMRFGPNALRGNFSSARAMYSALNSTEQNEEAEAGDSVVPAASKPVLKVSNDDEDSDRSSDEEEDEEEVLDPIVLLLESLKLTEYIPLFKDEEMDMEALLLCTDSDLRDMGLSFGPRKKILSALQAKKAEEESELTSF